MSDDEKLVTARDRFECFMRGHKVNSWGTFGGHCVRCHHCVSTSFPRRVWLHGETHAYPPAHTPESEANLRRLGYTRGAAPEPRRPEGLPEIPHFSRVEALALQGHEDDYLRTRGLL